MELGKPIRTWLVEPVETPAHVPAEREDTPVEREVEREPVPA